MEISSVVQCHIEIASNRPGGIAARGSQTRARPKIFSCDKWLCRHVFIIHLIHNNIRVGIGRRTENTQFLIDCTRAIEKRTQLFYHHICVCCAHFQPPKIFKTKPSK